MNQDGEYLGQFARTTADNIVATVETLNDDGTLMVREIGSRALHRASKDPDSHFTKGSRVLISRPSASGAVIGSGAVVLGRAPKDQRGLSATTPIEREASSDATFILSVDPDPLVLVAGGEPGEQTIIGRGFTSAATYSAPDDLSDPSVTDVDAPSVMSSKVVMTIAADADSPLGLFSASVGNARARNALRIVAGPEATPLAPPFLIVTGNVDLPDSISGCVLWVLDPVTMAEVARLEVAGDLTHGVVYVDGVIYWITRFFSGDVSLHAFNPSTAESTTVLLSSVIDVPLPQQSIYLDGKLLVTTTGSSNRGLWSFALDGTADTFEWADPGAGGVAWQGVCFDDVSIYIVSGGGGVVKLNRSTFAQEDLNVTPSGGRIILVRAWTEEGGYGAPTGQLCVADGNPVRWLDSATLAVGNAFAGSATMYGPVQVRDAIYLFNDSAGLLYRATLDGSAVDDIATLTLMENNGGSVCADGVALFHLTVDASGPTPIMTARRIDTDGVTLAESAPLDSEPASVWVYPRQTLYVPE